MIRLLGFRLLQAAMVAILVGALTFLLMTLLPGDAAYRIAAGRYGYDMVNVAAAEAVRAELNLDQPAIWRFLAWMGDLLTLDLGKSLVSSIPVTEMVMHELESSVRLALGAVFMSFLIGPTLGIVAGLRPGGVLDKGLLLLSTVTRAIPHFVLGVILVLVFAVSLAILPSAGHGTWVHSVLPTLTLALGLAAVSSRIARDATEKIASSPFYAFGRLKGLGAVTVFMRHGLRNIGVPIVTYLGVQLVYLIEGVVVVETLFAWPGIGHGLVHAIVQRDIPMVQGTALAMGLLFVLLNTCVDLANHLIDPRRRDA
ncbi:ABC transporter permease [Pseudomonas sp. MMS21-TM103]|uniref:ABC transporter permease n=1 Tax=Pseudomonas sp. MMS21 TM103 TaxID=2886506 RepID=UPI001EDEC212|nr:ABC transporter permease [Pseudomonas sp. MMS21 TM103]MCG4454407.1 ABC transporter permease [Pseudomonas sp. MMS21 TM103]